ncbi:hypothetical protein B0H15DRAFT_241626 [Mycena belliarum]|uniref:HNH nuclease domain-containing protein n=1 Tax=Mycena belliarum TaxID=1033014 RepID=A0AAD6U685_9AGAR|nr:hypothetical protein B0H15DRAFT_241626 [Mycena belliae]
MFQLWTNLDLRKLCGSDLNSPMNVISMSGDEHYSFGRFHFYLEEQMSANQYKARMIQRGMTFTNGQKLLDVTFRTKEASGVEPPNSQFLRIHAAFAKVLNLCAVAE